MSVPRFNPTSVLRRSVSGPGAPGRPLGTSAPAPTPEAPRRLGRTRPSRVSREDLKAVEQGIASLPINDAGDGRQHAPGQRSSFQQRSDREKQRYQDVTDSEYWVAVCFESRDQKEEFLKATGLLQDGDKYISGPDLAAHFGVPLTRDAGAHRKVSINPRWLKHVGKGQNG